MTGRVINKVQGFYYVQVDDKTLECHLRGTLKKSDKKENCVVGDIVDITDENYIINIHERKNLLLRPVVSNIDYFVIQFATKNPVIDYERLNILLLYSFKNKISPIIVINKIDLATEEEIEIIKQNLGFLNSINVPFLLISQEKNINIDVLENILKNKIAAFGGPSGVGKSSIINMLQNEKDLKVGATSERLKRGKHTTRDSNLMPMKIGGFIIDTPGFSSVELPLIKNAQELAELFPEFLKKRTECKFRDCVHVNEPQCSVKELINTGELTQARYDFYLKCYNILKNERWNKYD